MWEPSTQSGDVWVKVVDEQTYEEVDDDISIKVTDGFIRPAAPIEPITNPYEGNRNQLTHIDSFDDILNQFHQNDEDDAAIANFDYDDDVLFMNIPLPPNAVNIIQHLNPVALRSDAVILMPEQPQPHNRSNGYGPRTGANYDNQQTENRLRYPLNSRTNALHRRRLRMQGYYSCAFCQHQWKSFIACEEQPKCQNCPECRRVNYPINVYPMHKKMVRYDCWKCGPIWHEDRSNKLIWCRRASCPNCGISVTVGVCTYNGERSRNGKKRRNLRRRNQRRRNRNRRGRKQRDSVPTQTN